MNSVIEIKSVAEWNTQLRSATASGKTVVADAKAAWCGPVTPLPPSLSTYYTNSLSEKNSVKQ